MHKNKNNYYLKVFYTEPYPGDLTHVIYLLIQREVESINLFNRLLDSLYLDIPGPELNHGVLFLPLLINQPLPQLGDINGSNTINVRVSLISETRIYTICTVNSVQNSNNNNNNIHLTLNLKLLKIKKSIFFSAKQVFGFFLSNEGLPKSGL